MPAMKIHGDLHSHFAFHRGIGALRLGSPGRPGRATATLSIPLALALGAILAFSVIAFGAVENWSSAAVEVALCLTAAWAAWASPGLFRRPVRLWAPALFTLFLAGTALLQLVPLPLSLWEGLGDERGTQMAMARRGEELLRSRSYRTDLLTGQVAPPDEGPMQTPPSPSWRPASFTPALTLRAMVALLCALLLVLLLEPLAAANGEPLRGLGLWVGLLGVGVGLVALAQHHDTHIKILGFRQSAHAAGAFGPFVNENNGMGFVNLALCILYYLLWRKFSRAHRASNRLGIALLGLCLVAFHLTLLGIRTTGAGYWPLLLFPGVLLLHALRRRRRLVLGLAIAAALGLALLTAVALLWHFTDLHGRTSVWSDALAQSHWLLGNGLQSFGQRFQAVLTNLHSRGPVWYVYPENEYLQLTFEAGVPGLAAAAFAALYVLGLGWRALMAEGHAFLLVPALWGEALHACTDFHFHLWPVAGAYLVLVSLLLGSLQKSNGLNGRGGAKDSRARSGAPEGETPPALTGEPA